MERHEDLFSPKPQSDADYSLPDLGDLKEVAIRYAEENQRLKAQISRLTGKCQHIEWYLSVLFLNVSDFIFILYLGSLKLVIHFEDIIIKFSVFQMRYYFDICNMSINYKSLEILNKKVKTIMCITYHASYCTFFLNLLCISVVPQNLLSHILQELARSSFKISQRLHSPFAS